MLPSHRPPTPPGEMILQEFLKPAKMTQSELASKMGVPLGRVNQILRGRRAITAHTAILLGQVLKTSPELWMGLQADQDLWAAMQKMRKAKGSRARGRAAPARERREPR